MQFETEQLIVEHALQTVAALEVAIDVAFAYQAIRHAVIRDAIVQLKVFLQAQLGVDGIIDKESSFKLRPIPEAASFSFRMHDWPKQYQLHLHSGRKDAASDLYVGLHHGCSPVLSSAELREGLIGIREGEATPKHGWAWWYYLDEPLRSWRKKEALLALKSGELLEKMAWELAIIARRVSALFQAGGTAS